MYRCTTRALDFLEKYRDEDFFLTVSYDESHGPSLCPASYNTMYEGFTFDDQPNFADDLGKKPLMQQLWAGDDLHKTAAEINHPSKTLALFLGCNTFVDHEIGKVIDKINELMPGRGEGKMKSMSQGSSTMIPDCQWWRLCGKRLRRTRRTSGHQINNSIINTTAQQATET